MTSEPGRASRAKVAIDAVIQAADAFFYAETRDLSEGGLLLQTKKAFNVGTQLQMVLGQPPRLPRLDLAGVVKWRRDGEVVGVQFTSISPNDKAVISAFLASLPKQSGSIN